MRRSDSIAELSKAITKFQKATPKVTKDKEAKLQLKNGGSYSYKYADLSSIMDAIRGNLADCELSVIQSPSHSSNEPTLTTIIAHSSGEWVEDSMKLSITQDTPQGQGSAITYARRYMLTAMLGIVADDDNDAVNHRLLTKIQKKQLWDTAKKQMPDLNEDPLSMVNFLTQVIGKHPNRVLETEYDDAIQSVEMYTSNNIKES